MRLIPCQSSNVSWLAFTPGKAYVVARFLTGRTYRYQFYGSAEAEHAVTSVLFADESQGKAFLSEIKGCREAAVVELTPEEVEDLNLHV